MGASTLETWSGLDQLDDWLQAEHAGASQILLPLGRLDQVLLLFFRCCFDIRYDNDDSCICSSSKCVLNEFVRFMMYQCDSFIMIPYYHYTFIIMYYPGGW